MLKRTILIFSYVFYNYHFFARGGCSRAPRRRGEIGNSSVVWGRWAACGPGTLLSSSSPHLQSGVGISRARGALRHSDSSPLALGHFFYQIFSFFMNRYLLNNNFYIALKSVKESYRENFLYYSVSAEFISYTFVAKVL